MATDAGTTLTLEQQQQQIAIKLSNELIICLQSKASKVADKYAYYDADNDVRDFGISTPIRMRHHRPGIGWASRAVNTLSDRVVFDGFANDNFGINALFEDINANNVLGKAKHDAFIAGCAFVAIADMEQDGEYRKSLVPFTAEEATGKVDPRTGLLKYGLAVTKWMPAKPTPKSPGVIPRDYVLFTKDFTALFENAKLVGIIPNPTGRCLLHPITHRQSANRPLGKSRISNTVRRIIQEVARLKRRWEIAQEFYSTPQRYLSGLAEGAEKDPALDSAIGKVWAITKDEEGGKPDIGQLPQMSIDGFTEAKKDYARDFCAETALTLRNLGYETGNPTSAESLTAMSDDLLLEAQNSQNEMGEQIKQIAITLRMAMDGVSEVPSALKSLTPSWKPIFQLDVGAAGDALFKLTQIMPELAGSVQAYRLLGFTVKEAEALAARRAAAGSNSFMIGGGTQ